LNFPVNVTMCGLTRMAFPKNQETEEIVEMRHLIPFTLFRY